MTAPDSDVDVEASPVPSARFLTGEGTLRSVGFERPAFESGRSHRTGCWFQESESDFTVSPFFHSFNGRWSFYIDTVKAPTMGLPVTRPPFFSSSNS
jgi:hypothetical protein